MWWMSFLSWREQCAISIESPLCSMRWPSDGWPSMSFASMTIFNSQKPREMCLLPKMRSQSSFLGSVFSTTRGPSPCPNTRRSWVPLTSQDSKALLIGLQHCPPTSAWHSGRNTERLAYMRSHCKGSGIAPRPSSALTASTAKHIGYNLTYHATLQPAQEHPAATQSLQR